MEFEKEMTAPNVSVGADTEQSSQNLIDNSLTDFDPNFKGGDEMQREILRMMDPSYLKTVSMSELLDNVYQSKPPLMDGLLYRGTYLFVGAPKLGKSFLMTQLAYHISTGTPLWNYPVRKGTVLYLALEDDYRRLQERSYRMFGTAENESLFFSVSAGQLGRGLDEQLTNFLREHPDTSLIIIDTLQKVREIGGDNYSYANDYQIITRLKALADNYGICLLLVHHTRKQQADDKFDMISGTANGKQNGQTNPGNSGNANDRHTSGTSGSHRNAPSSADSSHGENTDSDLAVNPHQVPKTGDTATLDFWMLMSGLAGTIFCMVLWAHRKRQLHVK